jgi:L-amino acid N-acyltransferase YncA
MKAINLTPADGPAVFAEILEDLPAFWGERDMRALHHPVWLRQFAADAVVVLENDRLVGYLLGIVTTHRVAYVHAVATRAGHRGRGVGRLLYETFLDLARQRGADRVEATTTPANAASIAFHRKLGFSVEVHDDYAGPGQARVLFSRSVSSRARSG